MRVNSKNSSTDLFGEVFVESCTPTWTYLELSQMDVGQFFDLLGFENRGKLEELTSISQ
jgi:hypothetical protein